MNVFKRLLTIKEIKKITTAEKLKECFIEEDLVTGLVVMILKRKGRVDHTIMETWSTIPIGERVNQLEERYRRCSARREMGLV